MQIKLECLLMVLLFCANLIFAIILHYVDPAYGLAHGIMELQANFKIGKKNSPGKNTLDYFGATSMTKKILVKLTVQVSKFKTFFFVSDTNENQARVFANGIVVRG